MWVERRSWTPFPAVIAEDTLDFSEHVALVCYVLNRLERNDHVERIIIYRDTLTSSFFQGDIREPFRCDVLFCLCEHLPAYVYTYNPSFLTNRCCSPFR